MQGPWSQAYLRVVAAISSCDEGLGIDETKGATKRSGDGRSRNGIVVEFVGLTVEDIQSIVRRHLAVGALSSRKNFSERIFRENRKSVSWQGLVFLLIARNFRPF